MATNNGSKSEGKNLKPSEEDIKKLMAENTQMRDALQKMYTRMKEMENTWMLTRASMLLKILEIKDFNSDAKLKAEEELIRFLFPEPQSEENEKPEKSE